MTRLDRLASRLGPLPFSSTSPISQLKKLATFLLAFSVLSGCIHPPREGSSAVRPAKQIVYAQDARASRSQVEALGQQFAVATQGPRATAAAEEMFTGGGNIIDAAVAASFVLAVERPQSTGLTGGGFWLFRQAKTNNIYAVDFRERAPRKAFEKMFLNAQGKLDESRPRNGSLAAAVPGLVAGLVEIHKRFGKKPLAAVLRPAIDLAEKGFVIYPSLARALVARADTLATEPAARAIFLNASGKAKTTGELLVQKDLARTLRAIAARGRDGFYRGPVAGKVLRYMKESGGLINKQDLLNYKVKWRAPLRGTYRGYEVVTMPPPSAGGALVLQFLNFLEQDKLSESGPLSGRSLHLAAAALQSAFFDRAQYFGDPDFVKVPTARLIAKDYAQAKRKTTSSDRARKADEFSGADSSLGPATEHAETTHLSLIDSHGNMVSSTQTINGLMGAGVVVPGTGMLLNNEMDDFSALEGSANLFGAIGGKPNLIAPGKTPVSSMSPALVFKDGEPVLALGAPGGTRIISCVAQVILNRLEYKLSLYDSIALIRYHHQWRPDILTIEPPGPPSDALIQLKSLGYKVAKEPIICQVPAVERETTAGGPHILRAVADPRDVGTGWAQ